MKKQETIVEIFKTTISCPKDSDSILKTFSKEYPDCKINFDLEDCDNILRFEGFGFHNESIIIHLKKLGFECEALQ